MIVGAENWLLWALEYRAGRITFSALTAVASVALAVFAVPHGGQVVLLAVRCVPTEAVVTETRDQPHYSEFGRSTAYELRYEFAVDGRSYVRRGLFGLEAWSEFGKAEREALGEAGHLPVVYDRDNPAVNRPAHSSFYWLMSGASMVFCAAGAAAFSLTWFGRVVVADVLPERWRGGNAVR